MSDVSSQAPWGLMAARQNERVKGDKLPNVTEHISTKLVAEMNLRRSGIHQNFKGTSKCEFKHSGLYVGTVGFDTCAQVSAQPSISSVMMDKALTFSVSHLQTEKSKCRNCLGDHINRPSKPRPSKSERGCHQ